MTTAEDSGRTLAGLRVLIAEDSFHITMAIETALLAEGAEIAGVAGTLERAMKLARSLKPAVAVIDLNLGDEDSLPLIRLLRGTGAKMVIATGRELTGQMKNELSGLPVLMKPYTAPQLVERIRGLL